jgi:hypothetical protein
MAAAAPSDWRPCSNVRAIEHLAFRRAMKARVLEADVFLGVRGQLVEVGYGIEM